MSKRNISVALLGVSLFLVAAGCKKKAPPPPPPPPPKPEVKEMPPPPKAPSIYAFTAEPSTIERGQSATLSWEVSDATDIEVGPGIGAVAARGSRQVYPSDTTTYTLTAKGPGGSTSRSATVRVTVPPPPPPPPPPPKRSLSEVLASDVADAYFDYDKSDIREDARATLSRNSDALKRILQEFPGAVVVIEGHCDERGSAEYNLGLGERRATAARDFLVQMGVPADRLSTKSWGKERPQCTESNEDCWQKNRRAHFVAQ
jgi:peptidoglycan-associated lipoprotein